MERERNQPQLLQTEKDKSKHEEYQYFGPPGTGKTTTLSRQIALAAQKHGTESLLVSSFTRAAAAELVSRKLPIKRNQVATLHAHAYRSIGKPELCETKEHLSEWNEWVITKESEFVLSGGTIDPDDPYLEAVGKTEGDKLLMQLNKYRALMLPPGDMPNDVLRFRQLWMDFKESNAFIDFTDMIEIALHDVDTAPGNPKIGFFDEAQDFTRLELSLIRKWARNMNFIILSGDDDQCLYSFKGATPDAFLDASIPQSHKKVLPQSYRVPKAVHAIASQFVTRLSKREPKVYLPRFKVDIDSAGKRHYDSSAIEDGKVIDSGLRFGREFQVAEIVQDSFQYLDKGKSVMFLTACSYQLNVLKEVLRDEGLPFHNPYRRNRGDWNPLGQGKTANRILAFMGAAMRNDSMIPDDDGGYQAIADAINTFDIRDWDAWMEKKLWNKSEIDLWSDLVRTSAVFERGGLQKLIPNEFDEPFTAGQLVPLFKEIEHLMQSSEGLMTWLTKVGKMEYTKRLIYLNQIIKAKGLEGLKEQPQIIIGTIHSVKGGEADVVYVCPDLSPQGYEQMLISEDEIIRQYYVAMTRAFETLVICEPATFMYVDIYGR